MAEGPAGHRKELGFGLSEKGSHWDIWSRRVMTSDLRYLENEPVSGCPGRWKCRWRRRAQIQNILKMEQTGFADGLEGAENGSRKGEKARAREREKTEQREKEKST